MVRLFLVLLRDRGRAEQVRQRAAMVGVDGGVDAHAGLQLADELVVLVEIDPQRNASGNFVKVVQRVPVRIYFDKDDKFVGKLKAGMSVYATIDTNHRRSLAALLGFSPAAANRE